MLQPIPVVDLFAGPGGLGEGFSQEIHGKSPFRIAISVEKDPVAHQTLTLRSFFRQFKHRGNPVPDAYYDYLAGRTSRRELEENHSEEWGAARDEALCAELGRNEPVHQPLIDRMIKKALRGGGSWVLIGGPPCQAYSLVGRSRMLGALKDDNGVLDNEGEAFFKDHRHTLYRQYLRIIAMYSPSVFVMENVKGILSSKLGGERIFPQILQDLRNPAMAAKQYGWSSKNTKNYRIVSFVTGNEPNANEEGDYLIRAERYGVPQARHRVILLGVREDIYENIGGKIVPLLSQEPISLKTVIGGMPHLRSGFSKGLDFSGRCKGYFQELGRAQWIKQVDPDVRAVLLDALVALARQDLPTEYVGTGRFFPKVLNEWYSDNRLRGLSNHRTRSHMDSDLARYLYVAAFGQARERSPHLEDFPVALLPDHNNIHRDDKEQEFSDRFKVQLWGNPASTITCHISKDGHYFIHPDPAQCRSLTVREAARIQTFPDNYFFEGGQTQQYHQVGNAVPPYLAKQLATVVWDIMKRALGHNNPQLEGGMTTSEKCRRN